MTPNSLEVWRILLLMISLFNQIIEEFPPDLITGGKGLDSKLLGLLILNCPNDYSVISAWTRIGSSLHAIQYTNGELC